MVENVEKVTSVHVSFDCLTNPKEKQIHQYTTQVLISFSSRCDDDVGTTK